MKLETIKEKTVCFTGHRTIAADDLADVRRGLYETVPALISDGFDTFICGGALGFDTEAAECVMSVRRRYPHVRLLLVLPCRDQTARWKSHRALLRYRAAIGAADDVEYITDFYTDGCMLKRNRRMLELSSVCVAYMLTFSGGTGYTVRCAEKEGIRVINIAKEKN